MRRAFALKLSGYPREGKNAGRCACWAYGCADGCEASASVWIHDENASLEGCSHCATDHPERALAVFA